MRRGCISLGDVQCDECHRTIPHSERYLTVNEEDGVEAEEGKITRYCTECSLSKGYAHYKEDRGSRTLTFLP